MTITVSETTLWMTPRLAVAVNFAQFVALASHSKFSLQEQNMDHGQLKQVHLSVSLSVLSSSQHGYLRNWSLVVPVCMKELAITVAVWHTEFRTASWSKRRGRGKEF